MAIRLFLASLAIVLVRLTPAEEPILNSENTDGIKWEWADPNSTEKQVTLKSFGHN